MAEQGPNAPALFEVDALVAPTTGYMDLADPRYAYMVGSVQTDGHLATGPGRKGRLSVEINVRDIAILREFQRLTPYRSSIKERIRSTNCSERHHSAVRTVYSLEADSPPTLQPFTQMTCFSFATTSTRSRCCCMTCSMGLYAPGISSTTPESLRHSTP